MSNLTTKHREERVSVISVEKYIHMKEVENPVLHTIKNASTLTISDILVPSTRIPGQIQEEDK